MTDQPPRSGYSIEVKPHAYDPIARPDLFEGVMARRVLAFIVDVLIITIPIMLVSIFIFLFGIFTLGLGGGACDLVLDLDLGAHAFRGDRRLLQ